MFFKHFCSYIICKNFLERPQKSLKNFIEVKTDKILIFGSVCDLNGKKNNSSHFFRANGMLEPKLFSPRYLGIFFSLFVFGSKTFFVISLPTFPKRVLMFSSRFARDWSCSRIERDEFLYYTIVPSSQREIYEPP